MDSAAQKNRCPPGHLSTTKVPTKTWDGPKPPERTATEKPKQEEKKERKERKEKKKNQEKKEMKETKTTTKPAPSSPSLPRIPTITTLPRRPLSLSAPSPLPPPTITTTTTTIATTTATTTATTNADAAPTTTETRAAPRATSFLSAPPRRDRRLGLRLRVIHGQDFVAAPALPPPEAQVDEALLAQYQAEMNAAANQPLPGEDDDDDL